MKKFLFSMLAIACIIAGYFFVKNMATPSIPSDRLTYTESGLRFQYPESFGATIWRSVTWPPKVTVVPANKDAIALGCPMLTDSAMITESGGGESNDIHYSFIKGEDIGAGQLYTSTCYIFSGQTMNYVVNFEIHSHNGCGKNSCGAYCETENEQACKDFDMEKDVQHTIEKIISTVQLN